MKYHNHTSSLRIGDVRKEMSVDVQSEETMMFLTYTLPLITAGGLL
jgi:hypothetical protein